MADPTDQGMVVVGGIRYRAEDAQRLGLAPAGRPDTRSDDTEKAGRRPRNKARTPRNKLPVSHEDNAQRNLPHEDGGT